MPTITWQTLTRWTDQELAAFDVAAADLLCALGLPGAETIDVNRCQATLDQWARHIHEETNRLAYLFTRHPSKYQNSKARFRMMVLATVLQRDLGVHCDLFWNDLSDFHFFSNPDHLFVHGVVQQRRGTCSSLPVAYAAVGRRLGYPLKFVTTWRHVFLRWDEPGGEQFNVECTSHGFVSHPDFYYLHWPRKLSEEEVRHFGALKSLTPRQEFALHIGNRGHVFRELYNLPAAVDAYAHVCHLYPESWSWSASLVDTMNRWESRLRARMPPVFPPMTIHFSPRAFTNIPQDLERGVFNLYARETLLTHPPFEEKWWKPARRDPRQLPADYRSHIKVRFPQKIGENLHFSFSARGVSTNDVDGRQSP